MPLAIGAWLENRYRIDQLLGHGGMGAVYRAYDTRLQRVVAIKENTVAVPGISPAEAAAACKQFEQEALMLARLRHPNLPVVIDHFVLPAGDQYLVMDFIEGQDLEQIIDDGRPLPETQAVAWINQVCNALEYLHGQQLPIIHRDIKPQNIKITPQGQVFLVDFGIAKVGGAGRKTTMGALGVTPGFSPPEQ
jgi:serine/threonine protein kinase